MATVPLRFIPPSDENIVRLYVYESSLPDSGFVQVATTTAVGTYPDYIDEFTVTTATSPTDWFAIRWEDADGVQSPISASIQGGTRTLVGEVVERVKIRDTAGLFNEIVIAQDAEAVIEWVYKADPYSIPLDTVDYRHLSALVDLVMASGLYVNVVHSSSSLTSDYTAGLVSEKTGSSSSSSDTLKSISQLEKRALKLLGIGGSLIGHLASLRPDIIAEQTLLDSSRLLAATEIITVDVTQVDVA